MVDILALPDDSIGRRLKVLMAQHDMGPGELARAAGVPAGSLSHWIHGRRRPEKHNLIKLAAVLGREAAETDSGSPLLEPAPMKEPVGLKALIKAILTDHLLDLLNVASAMGYEITIKRR
jgi:transcriptional regulator with XRE-family HTH domain